MGHVPAGSLRALAGAAPDARRLRVDGVELAFDDAGQGETVVCLHATGHGAGDFSLLRDRLGHRYRFLALDWPGQGRSGDDAEPASAGRYARLLGGFLDALGLDDPILLGNSIGGAAAIACAAARPGRVRGIVLANSGGLLPVDLATRTACAAMARFFSAGARDARWFPPAFAAYYRLVLRRPPAHPQRRRIVAGSPETAKVLAEAWQSFARPEADLREVAAGLECPLLVTWAMQDRILAYRRCAPAFGRFRRRRVVKLRGGHAAFLEDPDAFAAAFDAFADDLATSPRR